MSQGSSFSPRLARDAWVAVAILGTVGHLLACFLAPHDSGDLARQMLSAVMATREGWGSLAQSVTTWSSGAADRLSWGAVPYNYPPLTLGFFQFVAWIHPSLFAAKLALTGLEALNAALVARICGDWRAGALYWAMPLSIWWVSHEGASEPIQSVLILLALILWQSRRGFAPAMLTLAVQAKLTAVFLAPWIFWTSLRPGNPRDRAKILLFVMLALIPTGLATLAYPVPAQVLRTLHWDARFNLYHWRAGFDPSFRWWLPGSFVAWTQLSSAAMLGWIVVRSIRAPDRALAWLGAGLFMLAAKFSGVFQPWYFLTFIPLGIAAVPAKEYVVWFAVTQLCEPLSVWQLLFGPSGPVGPHHPFALFERIAP